MRDSKILTTSGFSLIDVMVSMAISLVLLYAISSGNTIMVHEAKQISNYSQFDAIKNNITSLVMNTASWQVTIAKNSAAGPVPAGAMDCLGNGTQCSSGPGPTPITNQPFALYDAAGNLYFDGTTGAAGFDTNGYACNTYTAGTPTDNCIFTYALTWSAMCTVPSCANPQVKVTATLSWNLNSQISIVMNAATHSIAGIYR